jgi:hypothetical protein
MLIYLLDEASCWLKMHTSGEFYFALFVGTWVAIVVLDRIPIGASTALKLISLLACGKQY